MRILFLDVETPARSPGFPPALLVSVANFISRPPAGLAREPLARRVAVQGLGDLRDDWFVGS